MIRITLVGEVAENGEFQQLEYDLIGTMPTAMHRGERYRPGSFVAESDWKETDRSEMHPVIRAFADWFWTDERIEAAKKAFPWVPPEPVKLPQLQKWRFWAVLEMAGLLEPVKAAIDNISDPAKRVIVKSQFEHTEYYDRYSGLFDDPELMGPLKITPEQVDALWAQALAL